MTSSRNLLLKPQMNTNEWNRKQNNISFSLGTYQATEPRDDNSLLSATPINSKQAPAIFNSIFASQTSLNQLDGLFIIIIFWWIRLRHNAIN